MLRASNGVLSMSYKLLAIEGSGAYGTVAKARDIRHGRQLVALKILREDHIDNPRVLSRTRDEALLLSRLEHPAIVGVHRLDETLGRPIMVMEWLEALPLSDLGGALTGSWFLRREFRIMRTAGRLQEIASPRECTSSPDWV